MHDLPVIGGLMLHWVRKFTGTDLITGTDQVFCWFLSYLCNVCETLICKLVYLFIVFGEHGRYIGNINHLW